MLHQLSILEIQIAVCKAANVTMAELTSKYGGRRVQRARHIAMYIARRHKFTNGQIAARFNMSRAAVYYGIVEICDAIEFSKQIKAYVDDIGVII